MSDFGLLAPEIILLTGGLVVFLADVVFNPDNRESGRGYVALTILFLAAALIAVIFQLELEPQVAYSMVDVDAFSAFIKVIIYSGMILVALAGSGYMNRRTVNRGEFWTFFLMATLAMSLAASANNLMLLYITVEFLSITSYMLAGFLRTERRSNEAGLKYFLYGSVASAVMLYGISLLYGATGSFYLREIGAALTTTEENLNAVVVPATLLALVGIGFKASLAPFYQWAPDTYDGAPTPIATYLSTASKTAAFAFMARIFIVGLGGFQANWVPILAAFSIITMTMGNLIALRQTSMKRLLAYSSVAQAGYVLMGLVAVAATSQSGMNGLNGVLVYLFAYLFTNVGAFLVILAVEEWTGSTDIGAYRGLIRRSPALAVTFFIFLISLAGIPPTGGFLGKFYVFGAAVQHQYFWLAAVGLINAGIAAYYYLNVVRTMFFSSDAEVQESTPAIAIPLQISLLVCAVVTVWMGVYPPAVLNWADSASQQLLAVVF